MFIYLFLLARFHAARIAAQERALGKKSDSKAFTTFLIMTVCLFMQYVPSLTVYYALTTRDVVYLWLACFAQLMSYSSTICNIVIYYFRNTVFKQAAKRVIHSCIPCLGTPVIPLNDWTWFLMFNNAVLDWTWFWCLTKQFLILKENIRSFPIYCII